MDTGGENAVESPEAKYMRERQERAAERAKEAAAEKDEFRVKVGCVVDAMGGYLRAIVTGANVQPAREALVDILMTIDD